MMSSNVKWIKITTNIFDDEKIKIIDALPDADAIIVIWFKLLAQAGKSNHQGALLLTDKLAYTDEMLSTVFNRKLATIRLALDTFDSLGMIERGDYIQIANWGKHQNTEGLDLIREQNRIRQQRYRDNQKQIQLENKETKDNNVIVTLRNGVEEELEGELEKESLNSLGQILTDIDDLFNQFWKVYPRKVGKDKCYRWFKARKITQEFVNDLIKAINTQKKSSQWSNTKYIPHPYTWLNRGGWNDELDVPSNIGSKWEEFLDDAN